MPYIDPKMRVEYEGVIQGVTAEFLRCFTGAPAGELNYVLTRIVEGWLEANGLPNNYADYNEAMGVLECMKLELYRRVVAQYEDKKMQENGDVYRCIPSSSSQPPSPSSS